MAHITRRVGCGIPLLQEVCMCLEDKLRLLLLLFLGRLGGYRYLILLLLRFFEVLTHSARVRGTILA